MWRDRRDFPHGTGHGVGANLCVHEGPIGMSGRRSQALSAVGIAEPGIRKNMVHDIVTYICFCSSSILGHEPD